MPTISAKIIKKQQVSRVCADCGKEIDIDESIMRLYGNAEPEDPKYVLFICIECAKKAVDKKIVDALERLYGA